MYKPTLAEQETVITFDRVDTTASIYTTDPAMLRRLDNLSRESPAVQVISRDEISGRYKCPRAWIKVQKPRQLSAEQRQEMARRMAAVRNKPGA